MVLEPSQFDISNGTLICSVVSAGLTAATNRTLVTTGSTVMHAKNSDQQTERIITL